MQQGDIVIVEFPFADLSEKKLRPALVLSNDSYNRHKNIILAGIYGRETPQAISLSNNDLKHKKLHKKSFVSLQNIFSAERLLLGKTIDQLTPTASTRILAKVRNCF